MVKGVSRQVIVVRQPDTKLFEQAIFLLRDGADGGISDEALLRQAGFSNVERLLREGNTTLLRAGRD